MNYPQYQDAPADPKDYMPHLPIQPYDGTSGWSGTETSRQRVIDDDANGVTGKRQRQVLHEVTDHGAYGLTVQELREILELHHGQASAALTNLHHAGHLTRLSDVRNRCKVYVSNDYVQGREIEPYAARGPRSSHDATTEVTWMDAGGVPRTEKVSKGLAFHMLTKGLIVRPVDPDTQ